MTRLRSIWDDINSNYWFYPALFALTAFLLATFTVSLDRSGWSQWLASEEWAHPARPESASNMLTIIAGSMIGVASTVFSITIAAVAYASGNCGPRLLTNFMEDKGNQLSLATFLGTFVFALTVLRSVRTSSEQPMIELAGVGTQISGFVPQLSLLVAYGLMGLSIAVRVFFLNHIPASIRINTVLEGIGTRLINDIREMFPEPAKGEVEMRTASGKAVEAIDTGYVQAIDLKRLTRATEEAGGCLAVSVRTGDFVHPAVPLAHWGESQLPEALHDDEVRACFVLGGMRTPAQDLHFLFDELVEIGLRALSPGINDPFTAITALHWLGAAVAELGQRDLARTFADADSESGESLVLLQGDYAHFVDRSFGAIRTAIATSPAAATVTLETMINAGRTLEDETRGKVLLTEMDQLVRQARLKLTGPDLEKVEARYQAIRARS